MDKEAEVGDSRERIAKWLFRRDIGDNSDISWEHVTTAVTLRYYANADSIIAILANSDFKQGDGLEEKPAILEGYENGWLAQWAKANGYMKLAKDQTLPENPLAHCMSNVELALVRQTQEDMTNAGWRKVE